MSVKKLERTATTISIASFHEQNQLRKFNFDPPYQRMSVWTDEKQSYFIDSILRKFPIRRSFCTGRSMLTRARQVLMSSTASSDLPRLLVSLVMKFLRQMSMVRPERQVSSMVPISRILAPTKNSPSSRPPSGNMTFLSSISTRPMLALSRTCSID